MEKVTLFMAIRELQDPDSKRWETVLFRAACFTSHVLDRGALRRTVRKGMNSLLIRNRQRFFDQLGDVHHVQLDLVTFDVGRHRPHALLASGYNRLGTGS